MAPMMKAADGEEEEENLEMKTEGSRNKSGRLISFFKTTLNQIKITVGGETKFEDKSQLSPV